MRDLGPSSPSSDSSWYRQIFSVLNSGIAVYRGVDDGGDFVFLDMNPAAEIMDQVSVTDVRGRRVTEMFPRVADFGLLEVLSRVWRSGTPEVHPLSRYSDGRISGWRENRVFRLPAGELVAIYDGCDPETAREAVRARQATLAAELNYRVVNRLSVEAAPGPTQPAPPATTADLLRRMNVEHFRHLIEMTTDPVERERIGRMLEEELAKPDSAYPGGFAPASSGAHG